ncbi:hypothetical protein [Chromobacterium violaceum]|uniref:hypothetical protein n=1 Tax=Chromobacterium violaceum TaxID=536 RepID=UPI001C8CEE24|nr:hypothetical protein [Chromobacterium violaceum]MBX9267219.1 hypothetical protein [Chromobacterium violaceum]
MKVSFTGRHAFDVDRVSIAIQVKVDGIDSRVILPIEYLQDNFGLRCSTAPEAIRAYEANEGFILGIAQRIVDSLVTWPEDFILTSELMAEYS